MESRKITVVTSANQSKKVIMSNATTLRELKKDFDANDIDYTNMSFYEGTSKVELLSDDAVLPHDVPWKGSTTNELVFLLSNMNKKIESGATRQECYVIIKNNELAKEFKEHYGKSYTNATTKELNSFINHTIESENITIGELISSVRKLEKEVEELKSYIKKNSSECNSFYSDEEINEMFNF